MDLVIWLPTVLVYVAAFWKKCPVPVLVGMWVFMACWEVYDMHPDHLAWYSLIFLLAIYVRVQPNRTPVRVFGNLSARGPRR